MSRKHFQVSYSYSVTDDRFFFQQNLWRIWTASCLKELCHRSCILKKIAKLFKIVISNPFQSSPFSAILVPVCFRIPPLVFSFISKPLVLGFSTLKLCLRPSKKWHKISWRSSFNLNSFWVAGEINSLKKIKQSCLLCQNSYYI